MATLVPQVGPLPVTDAVVSERSSMKLARERPVTEEGLRRPSSKADAVGSRIELRQEAGDFLDTQTLTVGMDKNKAN